MSMPTLPPVLVSEVLHLRPGHSQMVHWPAGTVVTPLRGGAWLTETPRWLGEQLLRPRFRIETHAAHVLAEAGWVVLWAEHEAVLRIVPGITAPSAWQAVVQPAGPLATRVMAALRRLCKPRRGPARLA